METVDELKPSLFELLAEEQLNSLLPPTIRYLLTVATHRYPRYLLRVLNSFDEIYALAMLIVERYYLKTRGGSFTENFYGLKRERAPAGGIELPRATSRAPTVIREQMLLQKSDIWKNVLVMVVIPYLRRKMDEHYEINAPRALLGSAYTRLPPNPTMKDRATHYYRWFLLNMYPRAHATYGILLLAFNLAYLSDNARFHNPLLWFAKTRIRRMGPADYKAIDDLTKAVDKGVRPRSGIHFLSPARIGSRLLSSLSLALPASIFALKFLEWWYASDFAKQLTRRTVESLDLPPPVILGVEEAETRKETAFKNAKKLVDAEEAEGDKQNGKNVEDASNAPIAASSMLPIHTVPPPEDSGLCSICEDEMTTPTACQTGIVYCYTCIHRWILGEHPRQEQFMTDKEGRWESGQGRCAVTGQRVLSGTEGLRRIMV